uniref:HTH psq-type domain-containing protein n=1 Tax=Bracon brevicornis TaxID=1563983 RepID=A0A6V7J954_9HYME
MPRKKQEKSKKKGNWTEENLWQAIRHVAEGGSISKAAKIFGVPFSTIRDRLKAGIITAPMMGRNTIFTAEQESRMAEEIKALAKLFYGLTATEIEKSCFRFRRKTSNTLYLQ